jgi:hypothetical protein
MPVTASEVVILSRFETKRMTDTKSGVLTPSSTRPCKRGKEKKAIKSRD